VPLEDSNLETIELFPEYDRMMGWLWIQ